MGIQYNEGFYGRWLAAQAKVALDRFNDTFGESLTDIEHQIVEGSGVRNDIPLVDVILDETENEPTEYGIISEFGESVGWREQKILAAVSAMRTDLAEAVTAEHQARAAAVKEADEARNHKVVEEPNESPAAMLLPLAVDHATHDHYCKGKYETAASTTSEFRGCSIGCTINDARNLGLLPESTLPSDHKAVANLLFGGVTNLARLQDRIFEGLEGDDSVYWTPRLLRTVANIPPDLNWLHVWNRWVDGTMKDLVKLAWIGKRSSLAVAAEWAGKLHQRVARGGYVDDEEVAAVIMCANLEPCADDSPPFYAIHAVTRAAKTSVESEGSLGHELAYNAAEAGLHYKGMADRFIAEMPRSY